MMTNVNRTLFIPLYGKAYVSRKHIILDDPQAERIWEKAAVPIGRRSRSKWLCYNMAMRARVFDDWTDDRLKEHPDALVLHVGCGLDSRCLRVREPYAVWYDCDFPGVISVRREHYRETETYHMTALNAADPEQVRSLPDAGTAIVILEGISMYLTREELRGFFRTLREKYGRVRILMDIYTVFGAKASKYKNPINEAGVTQVYGIDDIGGLLSGTGLRFVKEHSLTPERLVDELAGGERRIFRWLFTGRLYRRIYRLLELDSAPH